MTEIYGDGGHSAVLRTLPLTRSLNRWICGSAFGYAQIPTIDGTSHIPGMLREMADEVMDEEV